MSGPYRRNAPPVLDSTAATHVPAAGEHLEPDSVTTRSVNRLLMRADEGVVVLFDATGPAPHVVQLREGVELAREPVSAGLRASMALAARQMAGLEGSPPAWGLARLAWPVEHPTAGMQEADVAVHVRANGAVLRVVFARRARRMTASVAKTERESLELVRHLLSRAATLEGTSEAAALAERARAGARLLEGPDACALQVEAELRLAHLAHAEGDLRRADEACRRAVEAAGEDATLAFAALHQRAVAAHEPLTDEASDRAAELCAFARARWGEAHPDTLYAESARVGVLLSLGRDEEARAAWVAVRDPFIRIFGEDDDARIELDERFAITGSTS